MEASLCKKICELEQAGTLFAVAQIIASGGSTPRKAGSTMVIAADGRSWGSVGGGLGEGEVLRLTLEALATGKPSFCHRVLMNHQVAADEGMVCGGNMEVFVRIVR